MSFLGTFGVIMAVAVCGGWSAGMLGFYIIGLRMPFIAVFAAHAAMAGAVFGDLAGLDHTVSGFAGALAGAAILGFVLRSRDIDPNAALGSLFSLMMGLAFLGIGLNPGPKSSLLGLMWGSLLFVDALQLTIMAAVAAMLTVAVFIFEKELKAILFSRELSSYIMKSGIVMFGVLISAAGVIAVNLETVGGLLLYSLIANPAVAALRLSRSYRSALLTSSIFGSISALGGFMGAYWFDLPIGACIVLVSSAIVGISFILTQLRTKGTHHVIR